MKMRLAHFWTDPVTATEHGPGDVIDVDEATAIQLSAAGYARPAGDEDDPGAAEPAGDGDANTPQPPPKTGAGSSRDAWAAFAQGLGLDIDDEDSREDIIEAVEAHTPA